MSSIEKQVWKVEPDNRERFAKVINKWGYLIQCIGWESLSDMYVRRVPPFQDVPVIKGPNKLKKARQILLNSLACEMKENGLEIHNEKINKR
jgi:hypothetical protein